MRALAGALSATICMSIVLIKQHSILDGIAGILLAVLLYVVTYRLLYRRRPNAPLPGPGAA